MPPNSMNNAAIAKTFPHRCENWIDAQGESQLFHYDSTTYGLDAGVVNKRVMAKDRMQHNHRIPERRRETHKLLSGRFFFDT